MLRGHFLRRVAKDKAGRGGPGFEEGYDFGGTLWVGFFQEPAGAFLDDVIGIGEEESGDAEDDGQVAAVHRFLNERNRGGAALPAIWGLGPGVEFGE